MERNKNLRWWVEVVTFDDFKHAYHKDNTLLHQITDYYRGAPIFDNAAEPFYWYVNFIDIMLINITINKLC